MTYTSNHAGVHLLLQSEHGPIGQGLTRLCNRIVSTAKGNANVDTGLMRSRIEFTIEVDSDGDLVGVIAARTDYSYYVHEGTEYMEGNPFLVNAAAAEIQRGLT